MEIGGLPDPDWYFENVLADAEPGVPARLHRPSPTQRWQRWWDAQARGDDDPLRLARRQGFVATTAQLRALGWARHDDRRERRRARWCSAAPGFRTPVDVTVGEDAYLVLRRRHALAAAASAFRAPNQVVSGCSAAVLYGLPTLALPGRPELTARGATLGRRFRTHVYGASLAPGETTTWFGTPAPSSTSRGTTDGTG